MSLSTTNDNGVPIAINKHFHKHKSQLIYLNPNNKDSIELDDIDDDIVRDYYGKSAIRSNKDLERRKLMLLDELEKKDKDARRVLSSIKRQDNSYQFNPMPPQIGEERKVWYVTGQSGSGKSYFSKELLKKYYAMGYKCFFISPRADPFFTNDTHNHCRHLPLDFLVEPTESNIYESDMKKYKEAKIKFKYQKKHLDPEQQIKLELEEILSQEHQIRSLLD